MSGGGLNLRKLRAANQRRLPQFRNKHGHLAHLRADGSDWSPAEWLQALVGELGELAAERVNFELGKQSFNDYELRARSETADVATYLDLFALRSMDRVAGQWNGLVEPADSKVYANASPAQTLMALVAALGEYANAAKKFRRGDLSVVEFAEARAAPLQFVVDAALSLRAAALPNEGEPREHPSDRVVRANNVGIDMSSAIIEKFNVVSWRVGCDVMLKGEPG